MADTVIATRRRWAGLDTRAWGSMIALIVLAADQVSKLILVDRLLSGPSIEVLPFLNFALAWNPGVSFGMFDGGMVGPWWLLGLAVVFSTGLAIWLFRAAEPMLHVALGLMIGGAIGNAIDRVRWGAVADFVDVHAFGWHFWTFNVADAGISVGAALLLADSLFRQPS